MNPSNASGPGRPKSTNQRSSIFKKSDITGKKEKQRNH